MAPSPDAPAIPLQYQSAATRPAPDSPRWVGVALLLAAAVLWSLAGVAVKWANADPIAFSALRSTGAALAMLPLLGVGARLTGRGLPGPRVLAVAAVAHTIMVTTFISAMTYGTAAEGILLQYAAPAWVALIAWLFLGRRVDRATVAALVVALSGVAIMLLGAGGGANGWLGPALGVLSGVGFAAVILSLDAVEAGSRRRTGLPANVFAIVLINNVTAAAVLGPWAMTRGLLDMAPSHMLGILVLGMVQMATPYILFQLGLRRIGPVAASLIALLEPVLNPIWAYLGAGEVPPRTVYAGGALILAAVAITALAGRRRGVVSKQAEASDLALPAQ